MIFFEQFNYKILEIPMIHEGQQIEISHNFILKCVTLKKIPTQGLIMCSKKKILGVESGDFSQAKKAITACKAEQIHKVTLIFTQNDIQGLF